MTAAQYPDIPPSLLTPREELPARVLHVLAAAQAAKPVTAPEPPKPAPVKVYYAPANIRAPVEKATTPKPRRATKLERLVAIVEHFWPDPLADQWAAIEEYYSR